MFYDITINAVDGLSYKNPFPYTMEDALNTLNRYRKKEYYRGAVITDRLTGEVVFSETDKNIKWLKG